MRSLLCASLALCLRCNALASGGSKKQTDNRVPVKLPIRHADPWAVKALIEGTSIPSPEISTILGVRGSNGNSAGGNQQSGNSLLLKDGYLVVNPTDNSLWWYPKKQ